MVKDFVSYRARIVGEAGGVDVGQKVADEFNPKRLPKGVYIVNGQKVMVGK